MALKGSSPALDLRHAIVEVTSLGERLVQKAAQVLAEEVAKRTRHHWPITIEPIGGNRPTIVLKVRDAANQPADGFQLRTQLMQGIPQIDIIGNDARGVLFGVGYLLRHLQMSKGQVTLPQAMNISTAPHYALRGHQIGYRDKTNAYDGWDLPQWDQYMREMAIFGANAIELIPPRSDDRLDSVHFPLPPMAMMEGMSRLADDYGLAVWIWYPALDDDYARPEMVEFALAEWTRGLSPPAAH